jgi:hypothetical protein
MCGVILPAGVAPPFKLAFTAAGGGSPLMLRMGLAFFGEAAPNQGLFGMLEVRRVHGDWTTW